jgi:hypothetical protein
LTPWLLAATAYFSACLGISAAASTVCQLANQGGVQQTFVWLDAENRIFEGDLANRFTFYV